MSLLPQSDAYGAIAISLQTSIKHDTGGRSERGGRKEEGGREGSTTFDGKYIGGEKKKCGWIEKGRKRTHERRRGRERNGGRKGRERDTDGGDGHGGNGSRGNYCCCAGGVEGERRKEVREDREEEGERVRGVSGCECEWV